MMTEAEPPLVFGIVETPDPTTATTSHPDDDPATLYQRARGAQINGAWGHGVVPHVMGELPDYHYDGVDATDGSSDLLSNMASEIELTAAALPPLPSPSSPIPPASTRPHQQQQQRVRILPPKSPGMQDLDRFVETMGSPTLSSSGSNSATREPVSAAEMETPVPQAAAPAPGYALETTTTTPRIADDSEEEEEEEKEDQGPVQPRRSRRQTLVPASYAMLDRGDDDDGADDGVDSDDDDDENEDACRMCEEEGDLLMCDTCPGSYHIECLVQSGVDCSKLLANMDQQDPTEHTNQDWLCPDCVAQQEEEEKVEDEFMDDWKRDREAEERLKERQRADFVRQVDSLVDGDRFGDVSDALKQLANMDHVMLNDYYIQLKERMEADGPADASRCEVTDEWMQHATTLIKKALDLDDAPVKGGIDMSKDPVEETCDAMEEAVARYYSSPSQQEAGQVMRTLVQAVRNGPEEHFNLRIALLEAIIVGQGFFPDDRKTMASFVRSALNHPEQKQARDLALKALADCPRLSYDSEKAPQTTTNGKKKKSLPKTTTNNTQQTTMADDSSDPTPTAAADLSSPSSSDSEPETTAMTTKATPPRFTNTKGSGSRATSEAAKALLDKLPKPSAVFPIKFINKPLSGQAQSDGSCGSGTPSGIGALLLSKGRRMYYNANKDPWPNTSSGTINKAIQTYIKDRCDTNADTFVLKYVSWGLARLGKDSKGPVWAYAFLRLHGVPDAKGVALIPVPAGALTKVFPTKKGSKKKGVFISPTVGALFKDARSRVADYYDPKTGSFAWYANWSNMRKAGFVRDVRQGKDTCSSDTTQLPVIDSRRLTDLLKPAIKTMADSGSTDADDTTQTAKAAAASSDVYSDSESDSEAPKAPKPTKPKSKSKTQPRHRKPPPGDPLLKETNGKVAGVDPSLFARLAAVTGMQAVVQLDQHAVEGVDGESTWVPASKACDDAALMALCPSGPLSKQPTGQANGTEQPALPTAAAEETVSQNQNQNHKKRQRPKQQQQQQQQQHQEETPTVEPPAKKAKKAAPAPPSAAEAESATPAVAETTTGTKRKQPEPTTAAAQASTGWTKRKARRKNNPEPPEPTALTLKALDEFKRVAAASHDTGSGGGGWFAQAAMAGLVQSFVPSSTGASPDPLVALLHGATGDLLDRIVTSSLAAEQIQSMTEVLKAAADAEDYKVPADKLCRFGKSMNSKPLLIETVYALTLLALRLHRPRCLEPAADFDPPVTAATTGESSSPSSDEGGMDDLDFDDDDDADMGSAAPPPPPPPPRQLIPTPLACVMLETAHRKFHVKDTKNPEDPRDVVPRIEGQRLAWLAKLVTLSNGNPQSFASFLLQHALQQQKEPGHATNPIPAVLALGWYAMAPPTKL